MREPRAPRGVTGARFPKASDGQRPPVVPRLQLLRVRGGGWGWCSLGYPSFQPLSAPAAHAALVWPCSHAHPGCAPLWYLHYWGLSSPWESAAERVHHPLVSTTPEFSWPE